MGLEFLRGPMGKSTRDNMFMGKRRDREPSPGLMGKSTRVVGSKGSKMGAVK